MMVSRTIPLCLLLVLAPVAAAEDSNLAARVKQIFRTRCMECHGQSRSEAGIDLLDRTTYMSDTGFVAAGDVDGSYLFDAITTDDEDVRMPRSPLPALEPDEIKLIRRWIAEGAKPFPDDVETTTNDNEHISGTEYVLKKILTFVRTVPFRDRRHYRFFSSNHLLTAGATASDLKTQRQAFAKAVNHLTWAKDIVVPQIIDAPVGSVFAVDIRKLGWSAKPYHMVGEGDKSVAADFDLYDQILLEYPYSVALSSSDAYYELSDVYLSKASLVRPIPFVRTDWFASVATQFPLYEDMLQLPHELSKLEHDLGVSFAVNAEADLVQRAGMTVSGVSKNNRVVERQPSRYGAFWKSFDFETSRGQQNMFIDPIDFHYAGGEMIWNLPNGLQGYLVTDSAGNRINEAPTAIVTDKFAADKVVRNGLACMRCHDRGIKRFADNIRPAFEGLPDSSQSRRSDVLAFYVKKETMNESLKKDETRFLRAMEDALGEPQDNEPLIPVSRRFLDAPITLSQAAGELGLEDADVLNRIFQLPQFTRLGLAGLSAGGVVRRDTWEDYFDRIVRQLGEGIPIAPVDGLTRPDYLSDRLSSQLVLKTNKSGNTFRPGDEMVITVVNNTQQDQFIELLGTDAKGAKTVLHNVVLLKHGEEFRFPESGAITIQPQLGREFVTVFASPTKFAPGVLLRGHRVADRFVHGFYTLKDETLGDLPVGLIKKTIKIETK